MIVSDRTFRRWVARLRRIDPLPVPVRVARKRLRGIAGDTSDGEPILIRVCLSLGREGALDTLWHEWTHAHRMADGCADWAEHPDEFWIRLGSIYRAWHREQ